MAGKHVPLKDDLILPISNCQNSCNDLIREHFLDIAQLWGTATLVSDRIWIEGHWTQIFQTTDDLRADPTAQQYDALFDYILKTLT